MHDLSPLLAAVAFVYGAALTGALAALPARAWLRRKGRLPTTAEAAWCAWLPPLAVLLLPLLAALPPETPGLPGEAHRLWHAWEERLHRAPTVHMGLHVANLLLLGLVGSRAVVTAAAGARARRALAALTTAPRPRRRHASRAPIHRLESTRPACFTAGLLRPVVYVTTGLLSQLTPRDRQAMIAHELAHARRRDGLTGSLLAMFYSLLPLPGGRLLRAEWERAAERACDAEAARQVGSRCDVAAALVRVAHLAGAPSPLPTLVRPFLSAGEEIEERVQALLHPPAASRKPAIPAGLVLSSLAAVFAAGSWLDHVVAFFVHH